MQCRAGFPLSSLGLWEKNHITVYYPLINKISMSHYAQLVLVKGFVENYGGPWFFKNTSHTAKRTIGHEAVKMQIFTKSLITKLTGSEYKLIKTVL